MLHHIIETIHYKLADGTRYLSIDGIFQSYKNVRNNFVAIVYVLIMIFGISFSTVLSLLSNEYSRTAKPILSKHYDVEKKHVYSNVIRCTNRCDIYFTDRWTLLRGTVYVTIGFKVYIILNLLVKFFHVVIILQYSFMVAFKGVF